MKRQTLFHRRMNFVMAVILPFLILSILIPNTLTVHGASGSAVVTRGKRIPYPKEIGGGWATFYYYLDGNPVYCLEPPKESNQTGTVVGMNPLEGNESLEKVLYYGYGGPGDCTDTYMGRADEDLRYLFTHIAASFAYCGWDGLKGCTREQLEKAGVWGYIVYIEKLPSVPDPGLSFTKSDLDSHIEKSSQKTEQVTLQGDPRNLVRIPLPKDITLHNVTQKTEMTGEHAEVCGGDTFYLSAPLTDPGDYESGDLYGSLKKGWKSMITKAEGNRQILGGIIPYQETPVPVKLHVKWAEMPYEAYLRIRKLDKSTRKTILQPGASFKIRDLNTNEDVVQKYEGHEISEFKTDETGEVTTPLKLCEGNYEVREIHAPDGYYLSDEKVAFTVKKPDSSAENVQNIIIDVEMADEQQKGRIEVQKHGEKVNGFEDDFTYEDDALEGVKFRVSAAEDIYTPDHQTDEHGNRMLARYQETELCEGAVLIEITTDSAGRASLYDIPLGKYQIQEIETQEGFLISDEPVILEAAAADEEDQEAAVTYDCKNERQRTKLSLTKTDEDTNKPLSHAVYGIYANQDITTLDRIVVKKDTLLQKRTTDQDGSLIFDLDLPPGLYYVMEIEAPEGYIKDESKYEVGIIQEQHLDLTNKKEEIPPMPSAPPDDDTQPPKEAVKKTTAPVGIADAPKVKTAVQSGPVKTGDESDVGEAAVLTAVSGILMTALAISRKKRIKTHSTPR